MQALLDAIAQMQLPTDAQRIFHGRGGMHPGCEQWTLDAYPPVFVLTSFLPAGDETEAQLLAIGTALARRWEVLAPGLPLNWVFQCRNEALRTQGRTETRLMAGGVPEPHAVTEQGSQFKVHVLRGQNHGLFLDMAEGRRWVRDYAAARSADRYGLKVLNLFAYTCAFSVVALQAGAKNVVNVDMGHGAIAIGQQNHQLNGISTGASFLAHDIFSSWGKITRSGPYGLVIVDPPSYQKGSFVATKDYARLMRRLPDLLAPGGHVLLCLNAPELGVDFLRDQMRALAPELVLVERVANPAVFADVDEDRALKVLVYTLPELAGSTAPPPQPPT
ncbi:MAG: class I SAM-dependent methyltransferase [Acidovorax soli]|uniref:class I SAM-dependent methyltransferase n=1 Tax=Comamonadaceae TaxID=80864 RepID=UPI0026ECD083|nr:class I SAM-dependent methyltransferase [Acidovorax soli]MCM2347804.1 class I SAM-dependent methyltransferase [Acidovorax soli]